LLPFKVQGDGAIKVEGMDRTASAVDTIVALEFDQAISSWQ